ncbi:hypothetical protein ABZ557_07735 [Streptomyces sp. NPDC019645]|uniref:hypothetical protein n=1 Tax=Streptomyces sp. NPDC019645 TaxID=3154786 RepID=UPI0033E60FF8
MLFEQNEHTVVGIEGTTVRLHGADGRDQVLLLPLLLAADGFALIGAGEPEAEFASAGVLESLPPEAVAEARFGDQVRTRTPLPRTQPVHLHGPDGPGPLAKPQKRHDH